MATIDVQVATDGGPWTDWLIATTATNAVYTGSGGHTYAFRVRATDGQGNVGAWDVSDTGPRRRGLRRAASPASSSTNSAFGRDRIRAPRRVTGVNSGALLAITGGPVVAGGYTWYQVTEPIVEWDPVSPVLVGVWVASGSGATPYLVAGSRAQCDDRGAIRRRPDRHAAALARRGRGQSGRCSRPTATAGWTT